MNNQVLTKIHNELEDNPFVLQYTTSVGKPTCMSPSFTPSRYITLRTYAVARQFRPKILNICKVVTSVLRPCRIISVVGRTDECFAVKGAAMDASPSRTTGGRPSPSSFMSSIIFFSCAFLISAGVRGRPLGDKFPGFGSPTLFGRVTTVDGPLCVGVIAPGRPCAPAIPLFRFGLAFTTVYSDVFVLETITFRHPLSKQVLHHNLNYYFTALGDFHYTR
jgi:hypothetical protein